VEDPTTIVLNLTFFGTLGVAFIMFLGLFAVFVATLLIAGLGRLVAVIALALAGGVARAARAASAAARPASPAPQLSADWADAVARSDVRAASRAEPEAAPAVKLSVRDMPSPTAPVPGRLPPGLVKRPAPARDRKAG
jgi:hypothetical protein